MNEEGDKKIMKSFVIVFEFDNMLKRCCQCGITLLFVLEIEFKFMTRRKEIVFMIKNE